MDKISRYLKKANIGFLGLSVLTSIIFWSCASTQDSARAYSQESAPCANCASGQPIELQVTPRHVELWLDSAWFQTQRGELKALISSPALQVQVLNDVKCKFCHSLSADGVDFDFGNRLDSLLHHSLGFEQLGVLWPGAHIPAADSADWVVFMQQLQLHAGDSAIYESAVGQLLAQYAARWDLTYVSLPQNLIITVQAEAGKSGGYTWNSQWALWHAPVGKIVAQARIVLDCSTLSSTPPDKDWSVPALNILQEFWQKHDF